MVQALEVREKMPFISPERGTTKAVKVSGKAYTVKRKRELKIDDIIKINN